LGVVRQRQVYSAESQTRHPGRVLKSMAAGMVQSRYMAYRLCRKDIRAEYAKSALGIVWDFLDPLVMGCVFYILRGAGVINTGDLNMPYAVFIIYGLLLYQTFAESAIMSLGMVKRSKTLLDHLKLPPEALILSVFFRMLFNSYFRILVMLAFSLLLLPGAEAAGHYSFSLIGFAKFVVCYPLVILIGMSIGLFLAPFNAIYADVGRLMLVVLFPLRYISQTVFFIDKENFPFGLYTFNPIVLTIENLRSLATSNTVIDLSGMVGRCCIFAVVFFLGWMMFHISISLMAERA